jgi:hypothetical protein
MISHPNVLARALPLIALIPPSSLARAQTATDTSVVASVIAWTAGDSLSGPRDHHVVFITQAAGRAFLHVAGGNTYRSTLDDVWRAPIGADGMVGGWEQLTPLPSSRAGHSVIATDRVVLLTGGQGADRKNITETLVARVGEDGSLGPWAVGPALPGPRFHHSMATHGRFVYVTGGLEAATSVPSVFRAELRPDGTLSEWTALPDMPKPRSHHGSFVHDGALYLVAGLNGNPAAPHEPLRDVLRAAIGADGSLGEWTTVSALPHAYGTHSAFAHDGFVYLVGGVEDNARFSDAVLRAPIKTDGTLGDWSRVGSSLPAARSHVHQTPVHQGRIYSAGGSARRQVTGQVWVGQLQR